ncbi:MAG: divalent-cation tolerance protein CutA [Gallionella sp.]|nr:divalent-cation tolerance protein CutA [Gallionella sp.]OIO09176.1 MAG: divalent-cation tolerance protein CutA [Gallionellaceae bacterium CG1_02_60_325]PIR10360.1 MAG: divalent-cation tolerance protein CutA [Gallionellaceae bacterium CG11_big_fil_rev_8_21_14_0_20_60_62]PIV47958.1 MAG: divalent-cation tolerance protein CutA [Gallionellaceae bacterium CG02_land_8_20_14_3_00_60_115]PIY06215.1 MAG: divalent-cation tolerance protein CutA [Gallionellaceae bacterium CG_4_10_14_3_um_filter_60_1069]
MSEVLLVFTTLPDRASGERIAGALVTERVAACVNLMAAATSFYHWQGKLERTGEIPLLIKTTRSAYPQLEQRLRELHPYDLPEIIALPVAAGLPDYLSWVRRETNDPALNERLSG